MKLITEKRELATKWFRFFAPIVSILVALFVATPWMVATLVIFTRELFTSLYLFAP